MTYEEWAQEQKAARAALTKAPARGGIQTPAPSPFGPSQGALPGFAPRPSNINAPGLPAPMGSQSKYLDEARTQPQPWIDDIDMGSNWYSPFEPVHPFGPPYVNRPREWDFPTGYNLNYIPRRMELMQMLRGMARTWGVLATIISTRQDQLLRIPWTIQKIDKPQQQSAGVKQMKEFFRRPDGKLKYSQWARKLTDDLLILDAPTIYFTRDRAGRPLQAEVLDGSTIFPLIDDAGRRPDSVVEIDEQGLQYLKRQPAFQQIIKGFPMVDLDESEIMYLPMRPRPDMPVFGYPPTEQIFVEASEAVRKTFYQLDFWAEGTIPDLIVTVPETWSPRQIAMYQAHMDAMLSGNLKLKSKVRFLPGGMKPFDIKNSSGESLWSQRDETLIRLACYAYSVSPAPFIKMLNRSTAQNAQQMAEQEGLYPLMSFWKDDVMDSIIQERFGMEDVEFTFLPKPEPDAEKQAKIHDMKIKNGEMTINEARDEIGLEPIPGGDQHLIYIGNAVIPLPDAVDGKALPNQGGAMPDDNSPSPNSNSPPPRGRSPSPTSGRATGQPQGGRASPESSGSPVGQRTSKSAGALLFKISQEDLDSAAQEADGSISRSNAQLEAGNYPKGHFYFQGLNISIENSRGSIRGKKTPNEEISWKSKLFAHYGYIRGTVGADGDQLDVFIGPNPDSDVVFAIDQNRVGKKSGRVKGFDEHKILLGYTSVREGLKAYLKSYNDNRGPQHIGAVVQLSMDEFKLWLKSGHTHFPLSEFFPKRVVNVQLDKADTISTSTGLTSYSYLNGPVPKKKRKKKPLRSGPRWLTLGIH